MAGAGDAPKVRLTEPTDPPSQEWLAQVARIVNASVSSGATAQRPTKFLYPGRRYFDTDLGSAGKGMMIYSNSDGSGWVDGAGAVVP